MAVVTLNTIKNWFKTGLIPTQQQFWDTWDSFRHKSEKIPVADVEGIDELLLRKTEQEVFEDHLTNENAHPHLLVKARVLPSGQFIVFKRTPNVDPKNKEVGDLCIGIVKNQKIEGIYLGGDDSLLESFEIINQLEF